MHPSVLGVIIAGGQSRRFNQKNRKKSDHSDHRDKFLMPFGTTTLLGHIISKAKGQIPDLLLNINGDRQRIQSGGLDVIADEVPDTGPLGGIFAAMKEAASRGYSHIATFSGDCPFFPDDYVARLVHAIGENSIALAYTAEKPHPVMGLFAVSLRDDLAVYIKSGERRVMGWIRRHAHIKVVWDEKKPDAFFNINHPRDLEEAERYLAAMSPE